MKIFLKNKMVLTVFIYLAIIQIASASQVLSYQAILIKHENQQPCYVNGHLQYSSICEINYNDLIDKQCFKTAYYFSPVNSDDYTLTDMTIVVGGKNNFYCNDNRCGPQQFNNNNFFSLE